MNIDAKRHKLLGMLYKQRKDVELQKAENNILGISFGKIYEGLECDEDELHLITSDLFSSGEIEYHDAYNIIGLFAKGKGVTSFVNEKYLKRIKERKKERVKFVLPIIAVLISLASLFFSKITNNNVQSKFDTKAKEIRSEIDILKFQVDKLKKQVYYNPKRNENKDSLNKGKN